MKTAVTLLLVLYVSLALSASAERSPCFDEVLHLTTGYLLWTRPDVEHSPADGVLAQRLAALPLTFTSPRLPDLSTPRFARADTWLIGRAWLFESGNPLPAMLLSAHAVMALVAALLGLLIFGWSRALFGAHGALLSLVLFAFCPMLLAHGAIVGADVAAALGICAATWSLWQVSRQVSLPNLAASTASVALLVITKMSFPVLVPIALLLLGVRLVSGEPVRVELGSTRAITGHAPRIGVWLALALVHVAVVIALLWLTYDFKYVAGPITSLPEGRRALLELAASSGLLPKAFLHGFAVTLGHADERAAFAAGQYSMTGFRWFFPYAFAIKTPLGTLLLLLLAPVSYLYARGARGTDGAQGESAKFRTPSPLELTPWLVLLAVYGTVCVTSTLNIGLRHMLPMYPALYVLAGANGVWLRAAAAGRRWLAALVLVPLSLSVVAALAIFPHHLAYFNELGGGPEQGYRRLVDSSLDWGQDLPQLERWLDRELRVRKDTRAYLSYFGAAKPESYGIRAANLPSYWDYRGSERPSLQAGVYAISASMLMGVYTPFRGPWSARFEAIYQRALAFAREARDPKQAQINDGVLEQLRFARLCAFLRGREPDARAGYSILIFRVSDAELAQATSGPPPELSEAPALPVLPFSVRVTHEDGRGEWVNIVPH